MSTIYPKHVRGAIDKLLKNKLKIDKVSTKTLTILLEFGFHGYFPSSMYKEVVEYDVSNVKYLPPESVVLGDLISAIKISPTIDSHLKKSVLLNRKPLIVADNGMIDTLIDNDVLTRDDVEWIVEHNLANSVDILIKNPSLAVPSMKISSSELKYLFTHCPHDTSDLYSILDVELDTLLHLSDEINVPPLHDQLLKLENMERCIELVKKYPKEPIVDFISPYVKFNPRFVREMHLTVDELLPEINHSINKLLFLVTPHEDLIRDYGIKVSAMFSINYVVEVDTLNTEDCKFVEKHINVYDLYFRDFAQQFRSKILKNENRHITMKTGDKYRTSKRCSGRRYRKSVNSIEEVLIHIDTIHKSQKVKLSDVEQLLSGYRLDVCAGRNVMLSNATLATKMLALKVIRDWKSQNLTFTMGCVKVKNIILMDMLNYLSSRILQVYSNTYTYIETKSKVLTPVCKCDEMCFQQTESLKKIKYFGDKFSDDFILTRVHDLVLLAMHGVICLRVLDFKLWGPLSNLLKGNCSIDNVKLRLVLNHDNLENCSVFSSRLNYSNDLVIFTSLPSFRFSDIENSFNERYSKVIIVLDTILEYMLSAIFYRIVVVEKTYNMKLFISKLISTVFEAVGVYFCAMRIDDMIDIELDNFIERGSSPSQLLHLLLRVILIIVEEINGTR